MIYSSTTDLMSHKKLIFYLMRYPPKIQTGIKHFKTAYHHEVFVWF